MNKKILGGLLIGIIVIGGGYFITRPTAQTQTASAKTKVTIYRSPTCGCCSNYATYLKRNGYEVDEIMTNDMDSVKNEHNIPANMQSCHTVVIEDSGYVVEGHIPIKAIDKLLNEKPDIKTIAMPGMPQGSPGMPGAKIGTFYISGIDSEGNISPFTEL